MRSNYVDIDSAPRFVLKNDASSNADASATLAADADNFWAIDWIGWGYDGTPTGGRLTVTIGSTVVFDIPITAGGPGFLDFSGAPLYAQAQTRNEAVTVKLFAGGSGVTGKVQFRAR